MVVVAAPAHITPRSARTHSILVAAAIATVSSGLTPSALSPAATAVARSPTTFHVSHSGPFGPGNEKALAAGVEATRLRNISGTDLKGRCSCSVMGRGASVIGGRV